MDQIGKLYQNRARILQEEITRLEALLLEKQDDSKLRQLQDRANDAGLRNINPNSPRPNTYVAPMSNSVKADGGLKLSPDYKKRDPLKADLTPIPQDRTGFELARTIQNIPNLPGQFFDKHPLLTLGVAAYSAVPGGAYRAGIDAFNALKFGWINPKPGKPEPSWKTSNPGSDAVRATRAQMTELERLNDVARFNVEVKNQQTLRTALGQSPPIKPPPPQPPPTPVSVSTLIQEPKPATPSTVLGGNYEAPTFPKVFDKPAKPTNLVQSVSKEILQGMKPGGLWAVGTRTAADSINDIRMDEWLAAGKPRAEADVIGHGIGIDVDQSLRQRWLANNAPPGSIRDSLNQVADELDKSIRANTTKQGRLLSTSTAGEYAIGAAKQPSVPRLNIFEPIKSATSKFDVTPWAQRYLNPLTKMGARNIAKGGAGLVGDLVAGEATERGLRAMGVKNDDAIGLARGGVGGAAGVATVLGLGGAAITAPAVLTGAAIGAGLYGAHRLGRAAMEDIKIPFTGNSVDDYISGISTIRKTPGITRAELDRLHPYKEANGGAKK